MSLLHCVSFSLPAAGPLSHFWRHWFQLCSHYTAPCASTASATFLNEAMLLPAVVSQQHIQPQSSSVRAAMARLPWLFTATVAHACSTGASKHASALWAVPELAPGTHRWPGRHRTHRLPLWRSCRWPGRGLGRCRRRRWQGGAGSTACLCCGAKLVETFLRSPANRPSPPA